MTNIGRKKFISKLSLGAIGTLALSILPNKLLAIGKRKNFKDIEIKIHPHSVKRNK